MPFVDLGGDNDDFFADGVVEEITAALSRIKDFFVIARQSAYTYKGRFVDVREVGHDLGVAYAVEGTVRRGGGRVRITVQLVDTETGRQLWSDRFEDASSGLFELQDRLASRVAGAINPRIRDRKRVVQGKGVAVRLDLGGRRNIKTKNNIKHIETQH